MDDKSLKDKEEKTSLDAEEILDKITSIIGVPSTMDLWDSLSMKISDKPHIIPKVVKEKLVAKGMPDFSIFTIGPDGEVLIDGLPEAEYFKMHDMDFLDMWPLRSFYSTLLEKFRDRIRMGTDITPQAVSEFTAIVSVTDMMKSTQANKFSSATRKRLIQSIAAYNGVEGVLPSPFKQGELGTFPVLIYEGAPDDETIMVKSPYLNFLMLYSLSESFKKSRGRDILRDSKGRALMAPNTSYLFKPTISNGSYGVAREFAYEVCHVIESAGSNPGTVPHISVRELISRVPEFEQKLYSTKTTANRNTMLRRVFDRLWKILKEDTILEQRYKDIKFPNIRPTMIVLDTVLEFPHKGKVKNAD